MRTLALALLASVILASAAQAQTRRTTSTMRLDGYSSSDRYSLLGGTTVPTGQDVVSGEFGWPSVDFGFTHGMSSTSDVGVKLGLLYGYESTTSSQFGLGLKVPLRLNAMRKDRFSVLFHVDPGVKIYTTSPAIFGFQFPVGATLGYTVNPEVTVSFGADLGLFLSVTPSPATMHIAPEFGPALEYHVDRQLTIGLNTRFGPVIRTATPGLPANQPPFFLPSSPSDTSFGFVTQLLLAYRM